MPVPSPPPRPTGLSGLRKAARAAVDRLRGGQLTPRRVGLSVSLGLFIGLTPLYGLHLLLLAPLAVLLRLDFFVSYLAANISIPPFIPAILFVEVQVGTLLIEGHFLPLAMESLSPERAPSLGLALVVGALVVGALTAVLGGACAWWIARVLAARKSSDFSGAAEKASAPPPGKHPLNDTRQRAIERVCALYRKAHPKHRYYVKAKLGTDPLAQELCDIAEQCQTLGAVLDAGAGRGQFGFLLLCLGAARSLRGFDSDEDKVLAAETAAQAWGENSDLPVTQSCEDLSSAAYDEADTILLLDVLHYLPRSGQLEVLGRAARALPNGGCIIVREATPGSGIGSAVAQLFERIAKACGVNRGRGLEFVPIEDLAQALRDAGLTLEMRSPRGALQNQLLVATSVPRTEREP